MVHSGKYSVAHITQENFDQTLPHFFVLVIHNIYRKRPKLKKIGLQLHFNRHTQADSAVFSIS